MAPVAEAGMAHTPSFNRHYSNPASRLAYERPWLIVLAVLAIFAFYVASGNYSFTRPLIVNQSAPVSENAAPAVIERTAAPVAETSSWSTTSETRAAIEAAVVDASKVAIIADEEASPSALTTAPVQEAPQQQTTTQVQPASDSQPATASLPSAAPAVAPSNIATAADRWATAGIVLVSDGQAWDDLSLANVDAALSILPQSVLANLGNPALGPLHILVNTEGRALSGSQPYGGAANYFSTNDGVNELVLYPGQRVTTVLHELGHAYNLRSTPAGHYAQVLIDPEMESFMAATGWLVVTPRDEVATAVDHTQVVFDYEGTFTWPELSHFDPLEDYANTFAMYYADPSGLRASSPERYNWMAANLSK